jgi:hypothetical protein
MLLPWPLVKFKMIWLSKILRMIYIWDKWSILEAYVCTCYVTYVTDITKSTDRA